MIVGRLYSEVLDQENKAVIDEIFADAVTIHDPFTGITKGSESLKSYNDQLIHLFLLLN